MSTVQVVADGPRAQVQRSPRGEFTILEAYSARSELPSGSSTWRTSFLVARDRRRAAPTSSSSRPATVPAGDRAARKAEQRGGRHARSARRARRGRRLAASDARSARSTRSAASATGVRSRQDRDRRRPLADDWLGEPERALAVQRHRDELVISMRGWPGVRGCGLWSELLELPVEEVSGDPTRLVDERWRPVAVQQRRRLDDGLELAHSLVLLPGVSRRSKRLVGPLQSFIVDG